MWNWLRGMKDKIVRLHNSKKKNRRKSASKIQLPMKWWKIQKRIYSHTFIYFFFTFSPALYISTNTVMSWQSKVKYIRISGINYFESDSRENCLPSPVKGIRSTLTSLPGENLAFVPMPGLKWSSSLHILYLSCLQPQKLETKLTG